MKQRVVVERTLREFVGEVETRCVVDAVLARDVEEHGGAVFHGSRTPRNSVRRTLSGLQAEGLVIRDGKGRLSFSIEGIRNCVIQGDVLDMLRLCPDASLPVVVADPSWSYLAAHHAQSLQSRMQGPANGFYETSDLPSDVLAEVHRALMPGGVFLCWFPAAQAEGQDVWIDALVRIRGTGLNLMRQVTWHKGKQMGYGYAIATEELFVFYKAPRPKMGRGLYDLAVKNVVVHPSMRACHKTPFRDFTEDDRVAWGDLMARYGAVGKIPLALRPRSEFHQAEKPVPVLEEVLRVVLGPGKHGVAAPERRFVVDLYAGSGSACVAARRLGADFVAVEWDERMVEHLLVPRLGMDVKMVIEVEDVK